MKTVLIPTNMNPWTCEINGMKFSYKAGTEQTVPDEVAELIEAYNESLPKEAKEAGEEGQVWTKEQYGAGWGDLPEQEKELPSGGTEGQVLTKTATGVTWAEPQGGGGGDIADLTTEVQAFWSKMAQILESEESFPPSFYADEAIALHDAIKTAKLAGKPIVASVSYNPWGVTVASDAYDFCFSGYGDNTTVFFRFVDYASFIEIPVIISRSGTTNFGVDIYEDRSYGSGQITIERSNIFHYSSLPS